MSKLFKAQTFGIAAVLAILLTSNVAQAANEPNDPVVLLLKGLWRPVVGSPKISFPGINLGDGSWITNASMQSTAFRASTTRTTPSSATFISNSPAVDA